MNLTASTTAAYSTCQGSQESSKSLSFDLHYLKARGRKGKSIHTKYRPQPAQSGDLKKSATFFPFPLSMNQLKQLLQAPNRFVNRMLQNMLFMEEEKKTNQIPSLQLISSVRGTMACQKICKTSRNIIKYKIKKLTFNYPEA